MEMTYALVRLVLDTMVGTLGEGASVDTRAGGSGGNAGG